MKYLFVTLLLPAIFLVSACGFDSRYDDDEVEIPQFNFRSTVNFQQNLSAYNLFEGELSDLVPSKGNYLLELSSVLFTDHAYKQRTVRLPETTQFKSKGNGLAEFPDGAILTKTFYYQNDVRDVEAGKRIIETRLLIKKEGVWNAATYLWNDPQTDAVLIIDGHETLVSWIDDSGDKLSTIYLVPAANECGTCHQINMDLTPLGPTLRNLNRTVQRDGSWHNQLSYLQSKGVLYHFAIDEIDTMVDYNNPDASLAERARAYLAMNCAHCHQPGAWEATEKREFDFRYDNDLQQSGILYSEDKIVRTMQRGEMPFIGTTMLDHYGLDLIKEYLLEHSSGRARRR